MSWWRALLVAAPVGVAAQQPNGMYVESRITTRSEGVSASPLVRTRLTREWTSAGCVRSEGTPFKGDSTAYQLTVGTPARFYNVVPRDRAVYTMDTTGAKAMRAEAERRVGTPSMSKAKLIGDGGMLLGHRTRKFETTISAALPAVGGAAAARVTMTTTYWVADDATDPIVASHRALRATLSTKESSPLSNGIVLRSETRGALMRGTTQVTTREVTVVRRERVPAARCALPPGYRTVDMLASLRSMQSATDELQRLSRSSNPADRARAKTLGDSMLREIQRTTPKRPLGEAANAVRIDGGGAKKP